MSLSIGIVGLPNVGKSTLFNALTDNNILAANYPFATIEPNTGIVPIPDPRLDELEKLYSAKKKIPATVTFVDIAGLVAGASKGEGLGNQFLANIRSCNAIAHVVRAFADNNVQHVDDNHDPKKDIDVINTELVLADLQSVDRRLPVIQKEAKANTKLAPFANFLEEVKQILDSGTPLFAEEGRMKKEEREWLQKELQLLTLKPVIYVFNVDENTLNDSAKKEKLINLVNEVSVTGGTHLDAAQGGGEKRPEAYPKYDEDASQPANTALRQMRVPCVFICAKLEDELRSLDENDRKELLESYGQSESGLVQLIHAAYSTLGLQSYLTAGTDEVRAWTIHQGDTAPQAAGVIHGDFERGFIAAQVVDYNDLVAAGSEVAAKQQGKVRTEGKTYIMRPDDVVEFRFNV